MKLLGPLHLSLLAVIGVFAFALSLLCRREIVPLRAARHTLGALLALNEIIWWIWRYSREGIRVGNLPLQLCDMAVWLAVASAFTDASPTLELAYFVGMTGAAMALLTPDLYSPWPSYPAIYFFLAHGGIVIAIAVTIFGGRTKFPRRAIWRSLGFLLLYAAIVGVFDRISGANYMYLLRKPASASLLNAMGPWPWYIFSAAGLALVLFWLLWLPVRKRSPGAGMVS